MNLSSFLSAKIKSAWAASGLKNAIPDLYSSAPAPNRAAMDVGFPVVTMTPAPSGGMPPEGADFNGILYNLTRLMNFQSAGGVLPWDSTFSTAIGGYPKGAKVLKSGGTGYWVSTTDNNTTNPDSSGAGWVDFGLVIDPASLVQVSNTSSNDYVITLPGGVKLQFGEVSVASNQSNFQWTMPTSFSSVCLWTSFIPSNDGGADDPSNSWTNMDTTESKTTIRFKNRIDTPFTAKCIAIGF